LHALINKIYINYFILSGKAKFVSETKKSEIWKYRYH